MVRWACRAGTRDFLSAFAALGGPLQDIFSRRTLFHFLCPHPSASKLGRQPRWVGCLVLCAFSNPSTAAA
jgi:hypothetical protein